MKNIRYKFTLIFRPFLLLLVLYLLGYTILDWLLLVYLRVNVREEVFLLILPFIIVILPVLIWMRPRIRLLKFDKGSFGLIMLTAMAIAIPACALQYYMIRVTGKRITVVQGSDIARHKPVKYYVLNQHYVDTGHAGIYTYGSLEGKKRNRYHMYLYIVMPLLDNIADTGWQAHTYWIATEYDESIGYRLDAAEQEKALRSFTHRVRNEVRNTDFNRFDYLEVIGKNTNHDRFSQALININQKTGEDVFIFTRRFGAFADRADQSLKRFLLCFILSPAVYFLILLLHRFKKAYPDHPPRRKTRLWNRRSH